MILFLAVSLSLGGCGGRDTSIGLESRILDLSTSRAGRFTSLLDAGDRLIAVTSNWESASLCVMEIPVRGFELPRVAPAPSVTDTIDVAPTRAIDFGEHASALFGKDVYILYADRKKDDRRILKELSRDGDAPWTVDVLEPPGRPVAILPGGKGEPAAFWCSDSLMTNLGGRIGFAGIFPFTPAAPGKAVSGGFTVFDAQSGKLLVITIKDMAVQEKAIALPTGVYSAAVTPRGILAVASFDPRRKRILLLEQSDGGDIRSTIVCASEETANLFLAPRGTGYLFLYDGVKRLSGGASSYALWLLSRRGGRYERSLLLESDIPLLGLSAVVRADILYALVVQDTPKLLSVKIPAEQ